MRSLFALIAVSPLALLAACGDTTPASEIEAEPMDESAIVDDADVIAAADGVAPAVAAEDGLTGSYSRQEDGATATLTFNADGTYAYAASDGSAKTGSFERMDDGRLMIADLDGADAYFVVSGGDLYRLETAETPVTELLPANLYSRNPIAATEEPVPAEAE